MSRRRREPATGYELASILAECRSVASELGHDHAWRAKAHRHAGQLALATYYDRRAKDSRDLLALLDAELEAVTGLTRSERARLQNAGRDPLRVPLGTVPDAG